MATNHTENYALNLWEPTDKFVREEFNENTSKLDAALHSMDVKIPQIKVGHYAGNGDSNGQFIEVGFTPDFVFAYVIEHVPSDTLVFGGVATPEHPSILPLNRTAIKVMDNGFTVYSMSVEGSAYETRLNQLSYNYAYLAIKL